MKKAFWLVLISAIVIGTVLTRIQCVKRQSRSIALSGFAVPVSLPTGWFVGTDQIDREGSISVSGPKGQSVHIVYISDTSTLDSSVDLETGISKPYVSKHKSYPALNINDHGLRGYVALIAHVGNGPDWLIGGTLFRGKELFHLSGKYPFKPGKDDLQVIVDLVLSHRAR
jgi:hypothetical protein